MLRGNLSTRPFYNERAVQVGLVGLAVVLGLLSAFTAWRLAVLTAQQREATARIASDESRAAALRQDAQRVRGRVDPRLLDVTAKATQEANDVIDQRTFSWTALFNVFERTIPADVRLRSVTPAFDSGGLTIRFIVYAASVESAAVFLDRLEAAGAFVDLRSLEEQVMEDGSFSVACEGRYLGPGAPPVGESETDEGSPDSAAVGAGAAGAN